VFIAYRLTRTIKSNTKTGRTMVLPVFAPKPKGKNLLSGAAAIRTFEYRRIARVEIILASFDA
jgi:hypothetical protein